MRKSYILLLRVVALFFVLHVFANLALAQTNIMPPFQPYTHTPLYGWEGPYESYQYQNPNIGSTYNLRFRLMKPNNWASSPADAKFPLILFFHGSGESASGDPTPGVQNNSLQLVHGGQTHMQAVQNGTFPGFLLYPQMRRTGTNCGVDGNYSNTVCNANNWGNDWREAVKHVVDKLITDYKVDPNRIYVHGLSGGGESTWQFITNYPEYVAAAHPMSAAGNQFHATVESGYKEYYKHIPVWSSQGGTDGNPTPAEGNSIVTAIRDIGGNIRYSYYPTLGHNTWNSEYAKPDFFSWFLSKKKNQPHVFYEQPLVCPGDVVNARLGFSKTIYPNGRTGTPSPSPYRIINYQWAKGTTSNVVASGPDQNEIVIHSNPGLATNSNCTPGVYYGRFERATGGWSEWSDPIVVDDSRGPSPTPEISSNGKSTTLPTLEGSNEAILYGPSGNAAYQWKRGGVNISGATDLLYSAVQAGSYTLSSKAPAGAAFQLPGVPTEFRPTTIGCFSNDSNPIVVTTSNGLNSPAPPGNFFATTQSLTSINITWEDRSNNELGFELYRSTLPSSGYQLLTILPASTGVNPLYYLDSNLQPSTTYYYRMRAVNNDGGSAYTPVASASTVMDNTPPTAPVLIVGSTSRTVINLLWHSATDNVGITGYEIYQNGSLIATTTGTSYAATSLVAFAQYNYVVKAKDAAGNTSPPSNQVNTAAVNSGVFYRYYHHNNLNSTTQIETLGTLITTGVMPTFAITPRQQNDRFAFIYEGFINIPTSGTYTFYTTSDDGSQLFINNNLVVNNDGLHGMQERSGSLSLSPGYYPIKVTFFENSGGEGLEVRWAGPGISKQLIPASALADNYTPPAALTAPNNFTATAVSFEQINISWRDNSNNETGFEISRAPTSGGTYQVVHVAPAIPGTGTTGNWSNTGLTASTQYFYRIRAINANSASPSVGPVNATTSPAPAVPPVPEWVSVTAVSPTQIDLTWTNVVGEAGYTIQKSMNPASGFIDLITVPANTTSYSNTNLLGNTTAYYRIRALGNGGSFSNWSTVENATTPNRAPVITPIPNQTLVANQATPQIININVTDPDMDPIDFTFTGLPATSSFESNGYGQGILSFTNVANGAYPIEVKATDGVTEVTHNFTINVGSNRAPSISGLSINGVAVTPTPITAVQNQGTEAGRTLTMVFTVSDPDGNNQLSINPITNGDIQNLPAFASASWTGSGTSNRTLTLTFNTTVASVGIYENITITFRDSGGGINTQTFSFIVNPVDLSFSIAVNIIQSENDAEASPWNNTPVPKPSQVTSMSNLKDENGAVVKYVQLELPIGWNDNLAGSLPNSPNAIYTEKVRRSHYITQAGSTGSNFKVFRFKNLNPALQYRITGYSASPQVPESGTKFTILGKTSPQGSNVSQLLPDLIGYNNITETRTSDFRYPASSGTFALQLPNGSTQNIPIGNGELVVIIQGLTVGSNGLYINSLILEASYIENAPPAAPSDVTLVAPQNNRVDISWADNSLNEAGFRIFRSTTPEGTLTQVGTVATNIKSFTDFTTTGRTTYYYRIQAYNAFGESAYSNAGVITTPNGAPTVTNPGTIVVTANTLVQTNLSASDPEGDPLTLAGLNLPDFATLVDNGNGTGFIRFTPGIDDMGVYELTVSATDNFTASAEAIFTLIVSDPAVSETVYINFTATTAGNVQAPWNNVGISSTFPYTLSNSFGQPTMFINRTTGTANWPEASASDNIGVTTGNNSGRYPDKVLQSAWVSARVVGSSENSATITLSGLTNTKRYNITILGSRDDFRFANSIYTVTTGTLTTGHPNTKTLNTRKNKSGIIRFTGVTPNASGNIVISVKRPNTDENGGAGPVVINHEPAVINAMIVEVYASVNDLPTPREFTATPLSTTSIRLTWSDDSWNENRYEIQRADDPEGPFAQIALTTNNGNVVSYDDINLPVNKAYVYRIRAIRTSSPAAQSPWSLPVMASTYDKIILVNINGPDLTAPDPWNNLSEVPANLGNNYTMYDLKANDNTATPVDLEVLDITTVGVRYDRGYSAATVSYPTNVKLANYLYEANSESSWRLRDLDPHAAYDLVFFGTEWEGNGYLGFSRSRFNERVVTEYVVDQQRQAIYNAKNSELAYFTDLKPEATDSTLTFQVNAYVSDNVVATAAFFNALEIRSYTPLASAFDKIAPTTPLGLVASNIASDSVRLTWSASTDNVGVTGYQIYSGTEMIAEVTGTTHRLTGLQPSTNYIFSVRARDLKGNWSGFSNPVEVTTLGTEATAYYCKPEGDITALSTWGTETNGDGTPPASFTNPNQHFFLNRNAAVNSALNLVGSNTRLIVTNGAVLTLNNAVTGALDAEANSSVVVNATTTPQLGTLAPTSTVTFMAVPSSTVPGASYGNLILDGSAASFSAGNYVILGDLNLANSVSISGAINNQTVLNISGNLTVTDAQLPADNLLPRINFVSGALQSFSLGTSNIRLNHIGVINNSAVEVISATPSTLTLGTSTGGGLTITDGSTFKLGKNNLVVHQAGVINAGNETGELSVSKGEISILSSGTQLSNLYFKPNEDTLNALHINAHSTTQVTIRSRMYIDDVLDVQNGRLNAGGHVALVSTATHTARIGKVGTNGIIQGGVEFQRYLDPKRVYRYMGAPVYGTRISDWQPYMPIIGPFQGASPSTTGNPSLFYYDEQNGTGLPDGGWFQYPESGGNNSAIFELGRGYAIFQFNNSTPSKLRITGPVHQGNFTFANLSPGTGGGANNGWNLLANVYASPIRWGDEIEEGWEMNDISGTVSIRENTPSGGGFKYWNAESGGDPEDFDGTIAQGQAFWVQATGSDPSITITEDAKVAEENASFFRTGSPVNQLMITLSRGQFRDKAFIHFSETSTDAVEGRFDALKRNNDFFNLSTVAESKDLAINSMSLNFCERNIPINVKNTAAGTYTVTINHIGSFDFESEMTLIDHFTSTEMVIQDGLQYTFSITTDANSFGLNRFELVIRKALVNSNTLFQLSANSHCESEPAPGLTIANSQKGVRYYVVTLGDTLQTLIGNGGNLHATLDIHKLTDGVHNLQILAMNTGCEAVTLTHTENIHVATKPVITLLDEDVLNSGKTQGSHQWYRNGELIDDATGINFIPSQSGNYAVEVTSGGCTLRSDDFSYVITDVETLFDESSVTLYPNPAEKTLTVMMQKTPQGMPNKIRIAVHNVLGQVVMNSDIIAKKGPANLNVENLSPGLYTITLELPKGNIQKRFVKK